MCGGISFKISQIPNRELVRFYGPEKAALLEKRGVAESKFWDERPVLPVLQGGEIKLLDWGNRDKSIDLPKTGWAKIESLEAGKWDYLNPEAVQIIAEQGYEKGTWFKIEGKIRGVKVQQGDTERVYMETKPASASYAALTKHDREPVIIA